MYIEQIHTWNTNSSMEPARIVCPCFGGRSPVVIYDLTNGDKGNVDDDDDDGKVKIN